MQAPFYSEPFVIQIVFMPSARGTIANLGHFN